MDEPRALDADLLEAGRSLRGMMPPMSEPKPTPGARLIRFPETRRGNTFDAFDLTLAPNLGPAYEQCRAVADGRSWVAFLTGGPGNGKTHLACAALLAWSGRGVFWKVPEFMGWLRGFVADGAGEYVETILANYGGAGFLLVLDDYGAHNETDWAGEQLYRLIDQRYENRAPTIVTSNAPIERIDERVRSRLREGMVSCRGRDQRAGPPQQG